MYTTGLQITTTTLCRPTATYLDREREGHITGIQKAAVANSRAFTLIDVEIHAIANDENGIPNTISTNRVTPMHTKNHVEKKITRSLRPLAQATVPKFTKKGFKEPLEYVVQNFVDPRHTLEEL